MISGDASLLIKCATLAGLRICQSNSKTWTLLACATRIANAQGIDRRAPFSQSVLRTELGRRLWYCIGVLDIQSAFDRGSKPLLPSNSLQDLPLNIDDAYISTSTGTIHPETVNPDRFSEMSFTLMTLRATICQRKLSEASATVDVNSNARTIWDEQVGILGEFEKYIQGLSEFCYTPLQRFTIAVGRESLVSMQLLLRRPLHKRHHGFVPMNDDFDVLKIGTDVLERSLVKQTTYEYRKWAWNSWIKWFALAIVLAELCSPTQGEAEDRAWRAALECYQRYAKLIADADGGVLWKPIMRLMRKAEATRESTELEETPDMRQPAYKQHWSDPSTTSTQVQDDESSLGLITLSEPLPGEDFYWTSDQSMDLDAGTIPWLNWQSFVDDVLIGGDING